MIKLGVTGGLASGKTTTCQYLKEKGAPVFNADEEAKKILFETPSLWAKLEKKYKQKISEPGGVINKSKLAKISFSSRENQQILNSIIHPYVEKKFEKFVLIHGHENQIVVADVPLLFEGNFENHVDETLLIFTDLKIRIERAKNRGNLSEDQIKKRMQLQMSEEEKMKRADYIIKNNGSKEDLRKKIFAFYDELIKTH